MRCAWPRCIAPRASGLRMAAGWITSSTGPRHRDRGRERARTSAALTVSTELAARRDAAARQVPRLRLVEPALAAGAARPGPRGARRRAADRLGRPAARASASIWTTSGSGADVQLEGDAELQQAVRFALFHVLQAAARAEQPRDPAKGLTGSGYDGHAFWDTETFVAARADLHRARRRARRAVLAPRDARPGRGAGPRRSG